MVDTAEASAAVAVPREDLLELSALLNGISDLFSSLDDMGEADLQEVSGIFPWLDKIDEWVGISWDDDAHQKNPDWLRCQANGSLIAAAMLDAIVADPYECLVPRRTTRAEIHKVAEGLRDTAEKQERLASGKPEEGDDDDA